MFSLLGQRGQALIMALLIMGVGLVVTSALVTMGTGAIKITRAQYDDIRAYYIAEAGIERALAEIRLKPSWTGFNGLITYAGGSYEVELVDSGEWNNQMQKTVAITSTGYFGEARKTLDAVVVVRLHEAVWDWPGMFVDGEPSQAWNGSLSLEITDENLDDVGKVFVRGNLTVSGKTLLKGESLSVLGRLTVGGSATVDMQEVNVTNGIDGTVSVKNPGAHPAQKGVVVPSLDKCNQSWDGGDAPALVLTQEMIEYYEGLAQDESIAVWDYNLNNMNGIYRHSGNLTLSGGYSGHGMIIVRNGNITITNNLSKQAGEEGSLTLVAVSEGSHVKIQTCTLEANVVAQKVWMNGSAGLKGAAIAKDVVLNGGGNSINFQYDAQQQIDANDMALPGTTIIISSWKEKHGVF
ncbi:MAG: pilus assembly PilX N-terminal domain-containing protein [Clostridia bacterium]|nr:pilus assembly PilX N-terminal domain-containing protein [Clostridia bacterium]